MTTKDGEQTGADKAEIAAKKDDKDEELGLPTKTITQEEGFVATDPSFGLTNKQVEASREKWGWNEIPAPQTPLYMLFVRQLTGFLPLLLEVCAIISLIVGSYADFGVIMGILLVNAVLGFREDYIARKALKEVSNSIETEIVVLREGDTKSMPTRDLVPGDICFLVGGSIVPADVKWIKGDVMSIDTAALTGEPLPRKYPSDDYGDVILSGTIVQAGECYGQVLQTGENTEIGKAQAEIYKDKSVQVISVFQQKIMLIVKALIAFSSIIVLADLLVLGTVYKGFETDVRHTISTALSIFIASIPVALPLVMNINMALGAGFLAKEHHAIVTSTAALQDIASMSMLCSDKTGTLTTANMSIITNRIVTAPAFSETEAIRYAYLCSNTDKKDDPIDRAVVTAFEESELSKEQSEYEQTKLTGFNPSVKRVVAFVKHGDEMITVSKGLPAKLMNTEAGGKDNHECQWKVENYHDPSFIQSIQDADKNLSKAGYKTIGVAMCQGDARTDDHGPWKFVGLLPMLDPPREDTRATVESLHRANISVKMITGDHVNVAKETARLIGLGTDIHAGEEIRFASNQHIKNEMIWNADGFAAVLPSDKREVVLTLKNEFGVVTGMTGDGVNDAPALSAAQVGIAVEGATDAAQNAADLILTEPGLSPIYGAVLESRRIFARIKAYVVYRVAASIAVVLTLSIIIFATGCAVESLWVIMLALFNDVSMIPVAYDNASATTKPQLPTATKLVLMSLYYGIFHTAFGLLFIVCMDHSKKLKHPVALSQCDEETQAFIWLHLVLMTELAIFSTRAPSYFFRSMPSPKLLLSVIGTCIACMFIAVYALGLSWNNAGWVWLYDAAAFVVADVGKVSFREAINDSPGDVIVSDELVEVDEAKTEVEKHMEKQQRYSVHRESQLDPADMQHSIQIRPGGLRGLLAAFGDLRPISEADGFLHRRREATMLAGPPRPVKMAAVRGASN